MNKNSNRNQIINQLCHEVNNCMNDDGRKWLQDLWRKRHGYSTTMASIMDMSETLAIERKLISSDGD